MKTRHVYEANIPVSACYVFYCANSAKEARARLRADDPIWRGHKFRMRRVMSFNGECGMLPRKGFLRVHRLAA